MKKPPRRPATPGTDVDTTLKAAMRAIESEPVPETLTKMVDALTGPARSRRDPRN